MSIATLHTRIAVLLLAAACLGAAPERPLRVGMPLQPNTLYDALAQFGVALGSV